ncbi:MAG TPA: glycoside hydrolase family 18 protein [Bacteroidia bacterium]|nr:glycoside hydrolase family 18 protein [Bacteroidia bacterium]
MKKIGLILMFFGLPGLMSVAYGQQKKEVMGYYAGWKWYDRNKLVNPLTIDYSRYTTIAYAFFQPTPDGTVTCPDPWAEKNLLLGANGTSVPKPTLVSEAHRKGVKVIISVGGWTYSDVFPLIAASPAARKKLARNCSALIKKYGIDGIDIDWEYPGYKKHNGSGNDTGNFTLLLQEIRSELNKCEQETGKKMLLTAAFGVSPERIDAIEWDKVTGLLDMINLMSYNYSGPWDEYTGHNAPLYSSCPENSALTIDHSVCYLTANKQVPAEKINIGLAFFGRAISTDGISGLNSHSTGKPDLIQFGSDQGAPEYYNIIAKLGLYEYHRDESAEVPYLEGKAGIHSFVTFDDSLSVARKAEFVVNRGLQGVIIWEITGDYLDNGHGNGLRTPLADAVFNVFHASQTGFSFRPQSVVVPSESESVVIPEQPGVGKSD